MDVKYLNYIIAIASHHNMTKAAKELYVSQSSLSQYLTKLEKELGTPLFYRSKGDLTLTPAGELYVEAARKVVAIQRDLYHSIAALTPGNDPATYIRVGITSNWGMRMMTEIIPIYRASHPDIILQISEINLAAMRKALVDGDIDVGLASDVATEIYGGQADILREEEIYLAVPMTHPFTRTHAPGTLVTGADIDQNFADAFFLMSKKGSSIQLACDDFFDTFGFKPHANVELNNISTTVRMVAQGTGIAFVAESCSLSRERIAYYPVDPPLKRLNIAIRQKEWSIGEPQQAFLDLVLDYFRKNTEHPYLAGEHSTPQN